MYPDGFVSFFQPPGRCRPNPSSSRMVSIPIGPQSGVDISALDQLVWNYLQHALAPTTQWSYASAQHQYLMFCQANDLCPVAALAAYLASRGLPLVPFSNFLMGNFWHIRGALQKVGVDAPKFAGHSFWIGAATTVSAMRVENSLIKTLGHWKSSSYLLYVCIPREKLASMSCTLARQVWTPPMCVWLALSLRFYQ